MCVVAAPLAKEYVLFAFIGKMEKKFKKNKTTPIYQELENVEEKSSWSTHTAHSNRVEEEERDSHKGGWG